MIGARVLLGAVASAHGIKGEVKVKAFTESPENLAAYGPLFLADGRRLEILRLKPTKPGEAIMRFAGVEDRNAAEGLRGQSLYVPRAALPEPEVGAFYHADLIGLRADDASGTAFGVVRGVHNFGAGDLLEVELSGGGSEFVPFTDANVPIIDAGAGRVVVIMPGYDED